MMKHLKSVIGTLLLFAVISCTEKEHGREVMGQVSFDISGDYDLIEMTRSDDSNASGSRVSDYTTMPQKDDFTLSIIDVETEEEIWNGKISQWSTDVLLPAGTYTATVTYGSLREEGFDKPYFTTGKKGDQKYPNPVKFTVLGGKTPLEVKVPVVLGNTLFKIECSDYFKKYFKNYSFKLHRNDQEIVTFDKAAIDAGKAAFVNGNLIHVAAMLTVEGGKPVEYKSEDEQKNLKVATIYTMKVELENVGSATPSISIILDDTLESVELPDFDLSPEDEEEE